MNRFEKIQLPVERDAIAPDGSDVRILLDLQGGGMAHFELPPGQTSTAVTHKTVEEIWYILSGRGEMWRKMGEVEQIVALSEGLCLTIPLGTHFQFRAFGDEPLAAVAITMPPWPKPGWVRVKGDTVVVKFGDFTEQQKRSLCKTGLAAACR